MSAEFGKRFTQFVDGSPTPFHCVSQTVKRLEACGFTRIREDASWAKGESPVQRGGRYFYTRNGSTIVAFTVGGKFEAGNAFKVVGAHTDSPALKVKPNSKRTAHGYLQVGAECYGGGLWHTWFDRDLGVAGRAIVRAEEGKYEQRLVHIRRPILRVPTLCIHLQSAEERGALTINKETHLLPIMGLIEKSLNRDDEGLDGRHTPELLQELATEIGCDAKAIVDLELTLCDTQPPTVGGKNDEFVFSPRLDNQMHCFTSIEALSEYAESGALEADADVSVVVLFDHEECGSQSAVGAGSPIMSDAVERISFCFDADPEALKVSISKSLLLSADGAHAVHPNYASKHETEHAPKMGAGTVIKTNDNQRYATNAVTGFVVRELARRHDIPIQEFVVRNDCPCGTTIGPIIAANTGIRTVDIGCPQLSMHSIRETCAVDDLFTNYKLLKAFYEEGIEVDRSLKGLDE